MNADPLKIFIERDRMFGDTFAVHIAAKHGDDGLAVMQPAQMYVRKRGDGNDIAVSQPAFTMSRNDVQAFMDELWHVGIRPTEGTGSAGSLAATQAHLKDMRAIVGTKLGVELK